MEADEKTIPFNMIVHYFSGTGNAKQVAEWTLSVGEEMGLNVMLQDISKLKGRKIPAAGEDTFLGFCSPTHGFNLPPVMLKFLWKFPRGSSPVFIMNTRAGMKIGRFYLCGLSGVAQLFAALILKLKGYRIVGMRPVDLPSNWISVHPGLRQRVVDSLFVRCEINVRRVTHRLLSGRRSYRALLDIVQDIVISPIALGYYLIGRYVLAKSFVASRACDMCGLCINSCPLNAIKVVDRRPFWTLKCESCMCCMNSCPKRAIETAHGLVIGIMYLVFTIGLEFLYFFSAERLPEGVLKDLIYSGSIRFLIASALAIPFLLMGYRLVHILMRFKFFERIIIYSSLSYYKFWRRYKGVGNKKS